MFEELTCIVACTISWLKGHNNGVIAMLTRDSAECFNVTRRNLDVGTNKCVTYGELWKVLLTAEPQSPIEFFDTLITTFRNLVDRGIWLQWLVTELKVKRYCAALALLE